MNLRNAGIILLSVIILSLGTLRADEGMWMLPLIQKLNLKKMSEIGFKLSARDIYDINNSSLKDAVLHFGAGCTAEIISKEGLVLTNHHCGYGSIQKLSTVDHDYLQNGYWAMNREEEVSKLELQPQPPAGAALAAFANSINSGDACGAPLPPAAPAVATEEVPRVPRVCACPQRSSLRALL